jgi:predicted RNase H-like nuclease
MATYLGLDGCRRGWVAAWIDDNRRQGFLFAPAIEPLLKFPHKRARIDIPIGLPKIGPRGCDSDARKKFGPSVFLGARRSLLTFETAEQANRYYKARRQPGISLQLWGIKRKIKEVDDFMTPRRQRKIRETHPELIFHERNNRKSLDGKKSPEGQAQRIRILKRFGFTRIEALLEQRSGTGIGRDDLIDACACAIAARDVKAKRKFGNGKLDARGLRMEIYY